MGHVGPVKVGGQRSEDGIVGVLYAGSEIAKADSIILEVITVTDIIQDTGNIVVFSKSVSEVCAEQCEYILHGRQVVHTDERHLLVNIASSKRASNCIEVRYWYLITKKESEIY
jgi:hypothetical protein